MFGILQGRKKKVRLEGKGGAQRADESKSTLTERPEEGIRLVCVHLVIARQSFWHFQVSKQKKKRG
jgi:hypothetical protein